MSDLLSEGVLVTDREIPIDPAANRRAVERQVIGNHFRSLLHLMRNLDSGMADPEIQQAHVLVIEALRTIAKDVMPALYEALDMVDPVRLEIPASMKAYVPKIRSRIGSAGPGMRTGPRKVQTSSKSQTASTGS